MKKKQGEFVSYHDLKVLCRCVCGCEVVLVHGKQPGDLCDYCDDGKCGRLNPTDSYGKPL
jgi:hypothetical protein